jgi:Transposase
MVKNYIGIDVGSRQLDLSFLQNGRPSSAILPNNVSAIHGWASQLDATDHCVFEATGAYSRKLEYVLSESNLAFSKVNPSKIKGFMSASGKLQKSDKQDAQCIRQYGELFNPDRSLALKAAEVEQKRLSQAMMALEKQKQWLGNQIHALEQEPIPIPILTEGYQQLIEGVEAQQEAIKARLDQFETPEEERAKGLMQTIPGIGKGTANALALSTQCFEHFDTDLMDEFFGQQSGTPSDGCINEFTGGGTDELDKRIAQGMFVPPSGDPAMGWVLECYLYHKIKGKPSIASEHMSFPNL